MRKYCFLLTVTVLFGGFLPFAWTRDDRSLNGNWRIKTSQSRLGTPPAGGWDLVPIRIPAPFNANGFTNGRGPDFHLFSSFPESWSTARSAWMEREFTVPPEWTNGKVFLVFEGVHFRSVVYLDGSMLGENWDGFLPFEFDLTDRVIPGSEHTVTVGAEAKSLHLDYQGNLAAPYGSFWGHHHAGIWADVRLDFRPPVRIEEAWIRTSVKDGTAEFRYLLRNDLPTDIHTTLSVDVRGISENETGPSLYESSIEIPANATREVAFKSEWPDARFWSPEDPFLYMATAELHVGRTLLDLDLTRFGFREFGVEGRNFVLNGVPIRLRGDAWHWMGVPYQNEEYARLWYETAKDHHLNTIRLHAQVFPKYYLDLADEMGMLIIDESALWASGLDMAYTEKTWERLERHLIGLVRRDRNHPSVILWSLANEILNGHFAALRIGKQDGLTMETYLQKMEELREIVNDLDGTRPIFADGDVDGDPYGNGFGNGPFPIISFHYAGPQYEYLYYWRDEVPKPVSIGEAGPMHYATPREFSSWIGPSVYEGYEAHLEAMAGELRWLLRNYRLWADHVCPFNLIWYGLEPLPFPGEPIHYPDPFASGVQPERMGSYTATLNWLGEDGLPTRIPNPISRVIREELKPVRLLLEDPEHRFFGGSEIIRDLYAINDIPRFAHYRVQWKEIRPGEASRILLDREFQLGPASDVRLRVSFTMPTVSESENAAWEILLLEDGNERDRLDIGIEIWPMTLPRPDLDTEDIGFYHPYLPSPGFRFLANRWPSIRGTLLSDPPPVRTLLVGADAGLDAGKCLEIIEFAARGGRVVVLEKNPLLAQMLGHEVETEAHSWVPAWKAFPNRDHPISNSFQAEDFADWTSDRRVIREALRHPLRGNGTAVLADGPGRTILLDLPIGRGRIVWSGLAIGEKLHTEPVALRLLAEMLSHAHTAPEPVYRSGLFLGPWDSDLEAYLAWLGTDLRRIDSSEAERGLSSKAVLFVDASDGNWFKSLPPSVKTALADAVERGAKVIIWGIRETEDGRLDFLLNERPLLWQADHPNLMTKPSPETEGIHPAWLYWLDEEEAGRSIVTRGILYELPFHSGRSLISDSGFDWRLYVNEGETTRTSAILRSKREAPPLPISALSAFDRGEGTVFLCQLRAEAGLPRNDAIVRTFLTNLGIRIHPFGRIGDSDGDGRLTAADWFVFSKGWKQTLARGAENLLLDWFLDGQTGPDDLHVFRRVWNTRKAPVWAPGRLSLFPRQTDILMESRIKPEDVVPGKPTLPKGK